MNRARKLLALVGAVAVSTGLATVASPAAPAFAICDGPSTNWTFNNKVKTKLPTNVKTPWATGPFTLTLSQTTTATATASVSATVSAEAGVIFAKASTSFGVTVGGSWSRADSWSATKSVPKGKDGRIRLYHEALGFVAIKSKLVSPCKYIEVERGNITAPVKTGDDYVTLETRAASKSSSPADTPSGASGADTPDGSGSTVPTDEQVLTTSTSTGDIADGPFNVDAAPVPAGTDAP
jgi:hypothetical protein